MSAAPDDALKSALTTAWRVLQTDPAAARREAERLVQGQPASVDARLLLGACLRRQNDIAGAHAQLEPLIAREPASAIPWFEFGMVLHAMGEEAGATSALRRATIMAPGFTAAWRALGDVLLIQGKGVDADAAYAQAARAASPDAHLAPAAAALAGQRPQEAERMLLAHLRQAQGDLRAMHLLGEAALRLGKLREAEAVFAECIAKAPGFSDARHSLAVLLYVQRKFGLARPLFESLVAAAPYIAARRVMVSVCLMRTGDFAAVLPHYEALLSAWPHQPAVVLYYAHALKTVGRDSEAAAQYRRCIGLSPVWRSGAYVSLANIRTLPMTDDDVAAITQQVQLPFIDREDAARLHYALGRAAEQRGDVTKAFNQFAEGARLRRAGITYDPDAITAFVDAARQVFTPAFFAARQGWGCPARAPIFVAGMPRAGSTLVEQILASHPSIEGTAELEELGDIVASLRGGAPLAALPGIIASLDQAALTRLGARYMDATAQYRRLGRPHFIDKMPGNILHAGLIQLILPNARIVDVRRAPMAKGLAVFRQYFQPGQTGADFSYDLTEIGRYTRDYVALTAHFDAVLPGRIHLTRYEALVGDLAAEVRRLLAYIGAPFDPACLRYWETARAVQTPSAQQVRQPIYRDGLDQWRRYAPFLGPLRAALGPLAAAESA
jgi:tetratricopeptide (TPR) repeat protein